MTEDIEEIEEREVDATTVAKLTRDYNGTAPGQAREDKWWSFSEAERDALTEHGTTGPLHGNAGEDEPITLDKNELRRMDSESRREATQEFDRLTKRAEADFNAGVSQMMAGTLDASQRTRDEVDEIQRRADKAGDPNERSALLQRGAAIVASLRVVPGDVAPGEYDPRLHKNVRTYLDPLTRRYKQEDRDHRGNTRIREITPDDTPEAYKAPVAEPLPDSVSVEEFVKWDVHKRLRFVREHPEAYQGLLQATDH